YVIKKEARGTTPTNGDPKDQLRPTHDLESPSVVTGGIWIAAWRRVAPVGSVLLASFIRIKTS
ncbi:hypothetical protein U9M48_000799, partial [Paspalum notatum var. saurae]